MLTHRNRPEPAAYPPSRGLKGTAEGQSRIDQEFGFALPIDTRLYIAAAEQVQLPIAEFMQIRTV